MEPGYATTEFWLTAGAVLIAAVSSLLVAFGVPLTNDQKAAVLAVFAASVPVVVGVYTLARTWRKNATTPKT